MSSEEFVESDALVEDESAVYEDDEFDEYSDSFEASSGDDSSKIDAAHSTKSAPGLPVAPQNVKSSCRFEIGDHVQVYWAEEREWFNGRVVQADALSGRFFVQYDDGEQAWETGEYMRYAPEAFALKSEAFQQLQLTLHSATQHDENVVLLPLLGVKVLVFWRESSSWFPGSIVQVDQQGGALQVEYEDGDLRWEPERDFLNILVLLVSNMASETSVDQAKSHVAPSHLAARADPEADADLVERVITPRTYKAVLTDHFQPERTPRPYTSVTNTVGSVLTARRGKYSERRYLHNAKLECAPCETPQSATDELLSRDCLVQTDIAGAVWTDNSGDRAQYSQCC